MAEELRRFLDCKYPPSQELCVQILTLYHNASRVKDFWQLRNVDQLISSLWRDGNSEVLADKLLSVDDETAYDLLDFLLRS